MSKQVTKAQIEDWKAKYGNVYKVEVDGKVAYLHRPDRKTLSYASTLAQGNPVKSNEVLLEGMWIDGDDVIKTDDALFFGVAQKLSEITLVAEAEVVKL